MLAPWKKSYDKPRWHIKKQRHYFANKFHIGKTLVFPVLLYGCKSWTMKKLSAEEPILLNCGAVKTLENTLDSKEIKPVSLKGK